MGKVAGKDCRILIEVTPGLTSVQAIFEQTPGVYLITNSVDHGYIVGQYVRLLGVDTTDTLDGYHKIITVPELDEFIVETASPGLISSDAGTSEVFDVRPAFDFNVNFSADELDVTEFTSDDWREFLTGLVGGEISYNYYKRTEELDVDSGATLTLLFVLGNYSIEATTIISGRETGAEIEDACKVGITARITEAVTELNT
jgi:hypothetical protein